MAAYPSNSYSPSLSLVLKFKESNPMTYAEAVKFLVAMIIMMNPLGSLSIYIQLTKKYTSLEQKQTAIRCATAIMMIMVFTLWLGSEILELLGITLASFRFAGGIILLLVGFSMLQSKESPLSHTPEDEAAAKGRASIAIVPMALPTIIGPGSMSTLIIAANDYPIFLQTAWLSILCCILAAGMGGILYYSGAIARLVGESVIKVITRIMGMIIMAIAVGMLANGLKGLFPTLG
jgi:multiple antibiotic resistance protein